MFRVWMALGIAGLIGIDQLTKYIMIAWLETEGASFALIPGVFEFELKYNDGAAFSMLEGQNWLLILLPLVVSLVMLGVLFSGKWRGYRLVNIGGVLLVSGGIGNLIDRIVSGGQVTDFLYFKLINFPIFNFADCCVVIGAALILIFLLFCYEDTAKQPIKPALPDEGEAE